MILINFLMEKLVYRITC